MREQLCLEDLENRRGVENIAVGDVDVEVLDLCPMLSQRPEHTGVELGNVHRITCSVPGFISISFPFGGVIAGILRVSEVSRAVVELREKPRKTLNL